MFTRAARIALLLAVTLQTLPLKASGNHWPIDRAHSRVLFAVTKWGFAEVEGRFHDFSGSVMFDTAAPEKSHVEWIVKLATVDTGEPARDHTLQAPEYFDTAKYPDMTFTSSSVKTAGNDDFDVAGALTIRGVTKLLSVRVHYNGRHAVPAEGTFDVFQTSFTINRYDFGVVGGSLMGAAISKDVRISLTATARQPQ